VKRGKRGQSSVEYIFIVAFALMIIIPGAFVFTQYSSDSQTGLRNAQIYRVGNDIVDSAALMYSVGENSWLTIDVTFHSDVRDVKVYNGTNGNSLVITYQDTSLSSAVFFTEIPMTNSSGSDCTNGCIIPFNEGLNSIRVESTRNSNVVLRLVR
jgi:uncharacterized protein (UPF0333 family)